MLTAEQIDQIKRAMEEEHRLDILALERLSRFLPITSKNQPQISNPNGESQLDQVRAVLEENPDRTWTIRTVLEELNRRGVEIKAKSPTVSISAVLKKLSDRGVLTLVRVGAGREPSIYQYRQPRNDETS